MNIKDHHFTLGIEEEFQIIDPQTRELRSHVQQILEEGKMTLKENVKAEMHQSVIELGTDICESAASARDQVISLRSDLAALAPTHFPTGTTSASPKANVTRPSSRTCNRWRART